MRQFELGPRSSGILRLVFISIFSCLLWFVSATIAAAANVSAVCSTSTLPVLPVRSAQVLYSRLTLKLKWKQLENCRVGKDSGNKQNFVSAAKNCQKQQKCLVNKIINGKTVKDLFKETPSKKLVVSNFSSDHMSNRSNQTTGYDSSTLARSSSLCLPPIFIPPDTNR